MSDRSIVDSSALRSAKSSKLIGIEVRPVVRDDAVWDSISECQFSDKTNSGAGFKILDRFSFDPFGKLVDCNEHMSEALLPVLSGPTISSPQTAKGQTRGMVFRADAGL